VTTRSTDVRFSPTLSAAYTVSVVPLSILDLSPIVEGGDAAQSLRNTLDLAQHAERWGYRRYWLAEHHNMDGVASSATAVLIGHVAGGTNTMRVGAGGVMLPNHAPLVIAEQFGTLATLYPGRIDLGLGRAPGTDQLTMRALRRHLDTIDEDDFLRDVQELQSYLDDPRPDQWVHAVPGMGTKVPIWLLGSSLYSAQVAGLMGLPFAFASHFAPDLLLQALQAYRTRFQPSPTLQRPHVMVGVNVVCAETDADARYHATSIYLRFLGMQRGRRGPLPRPVASMDELWTEAERAGVERMLAMSAIGSPDTVRARLAQIVTATHAEELIIACAVHDHHARLRSYELVADARDQG
jgi:luciferase family oxidoreductase group 1